MNSVAANLSAGKKAVPRRRVFSFRLLASAFTCFAAPLCSAPLSAATPVIFQQAELTLTAFGPPPTASAPDPDKPAPAYPSRSFHLRAQMRPSNTLEQPDLFSIDPFARASAHLFVFDPPALTAFQAPYIQKPVDLLAVDVHGTIHEIIPRAIPANLDPSQYAVDEPVRALLLLPAGTVDANALRPGDRVQHPLFTRLPEKRK